MKRRGGLKKKKMAGRSSSRRAASGENVVCRVGHRRVWLLSAVGVVVVAYGVDLTERGVGAGSLSRGGLGSVGDGGSADLGGAAVVEILEAASGSEGSSGFPVREAGYGV